MNIFAKAGRNPGLAFSQKGGVPPHAKVEPHKTKNRLRAGKFEKRDGGWLKKYEKDLQEKTTSGRIFPSAQRDLHPGIERRGDRCVRIPAVL